jgi:large subunit ribosomal protein L6
MINIKIPDGISVDAGDGVVHTTGRLGKNERRFNPKLTSVRVDGGEVIVEEVGSRAAKRRSYMAAVALSKEIETDMRGVMEYNEIHMEVVYAHFPITVEAKDGKIFIKNMLGERAPRKAGIVGDTKIEVNGKDVRLYGSSLYDISQTAANIRIACRVREKDERVFQDGIYYAKV